MFSSCGQASSMPLQLSLWRSSEPWLICAWQDQLYGPSIGVILLCTRMSSLRISHDVCKRCNEASESTGCAELVSLVSLRLCHLGHSTFLVLYPLRAFLVCNNVLASLLHQAPPFQFETAALLSLTFPTECWLACLSRSPPTLLSGCVSMLWRLLPSFV